MSRPVLLKAGLFLATLICLSGCVTEEEPLVIRGTVTFQGEPVGEGLIQFTDSKTGRGAEVELRADGSYEAKLFVGTYDVLISPPYIVDVKASIPDPKYKKVKNIPSKYHSTVTSGLSAAVTKEQTNHNFDMK